MMHAVAYQRRYMALWGAFGHALGWALRAAAYMYLLTFGKARRSLSRLYVWLLCCTRCIADMLQDTN
jgi:hypothetical protein